MYSQLQLGTNQLKNVIQAYLSGILAHKSRSVHIPSDKITELKKKSSMKHESSQVLKGYSLTCFNFKEMQNLRMSIIS